MGEHRAPEDLADLHFVPFPPVERLAVIGDRRTAAIVAADGTVSWMCLPRFDATPIFGSMLDLKKGGYWRLGPEEREFGSQSYLPGTAILVTRWTAPEGVLELVETMIWPDDVRSTSLEHRRIVVRCLRCVSGRRRVVHRIEPREDFRSPAHMSDTGSYLRIQTRAFDLGLWSSHALDCTKAGDGANVVRALSAGEEIWTVLDDAASAGDWTVETARRALEGCHRYWQEWSGGLTCPGSRADELRFAAIVVHLCTYAPTGAPIASPTASLPERVPGSYNYDYRYCWVRDAALSARLLGQLGMTAPVGRYLDFIAGRLGDTDDRHERPVRTLYRIDGGTQTPADERPDVSGYRQCRPVRLGNPAFQMDEIDGFGFLADCALTFVEGGGEMTETQWNLVRRSADFVSHNWHQKSAGTWELMPYDHFIATKVMSWVTLDRALTIAKRTRHAPPAAWRKARNAIHAEVLEKGWSSKADAFTQRYGSDTMDATALLIALTGFLPARDERVRKTVERVDRVLKLNGLVHRFVPDRTPGRPDEPMGDCEGAYLMCTFWLAEAWQMLGEPEKARIAIERGEACRGTSKLFSEAADARHIPGLLGNMPLLFTQTAYARAALALG